MPAPQLPTILTESDWSRNKGTIAKIAGETGIGAALQNVKRAFDAVNWNRFDPEQACQGARAPSDIDRALTELANEFRGKVEPLRGELAKVHDLANNTATKFKANKLIAASSTEHVLKLGMAAMQFMAQLKLLGTPAPGFAKAKEKLSVVLVDELVGAEWFQTLATLQFPRDADLKKWIEDPQMSLSMADGAKNSNLENIQRRAGVELRRFVDIATRLNSLKGRTVQRSDGIGNFAKLWREASDCFYVMKPGLQGIHREWAIRQGQLEAAPKGRPTAEIAFKRNDMEALHKRVEVLLFNEEVKMQKLDKIVDDAEYALKS
jgi:hypothetical protein